MIHKSDAVACILPRRVQNNQKHVNETEPF